MFTFVSDVIRIGPSRSVFSTVRSKVVNPILPDWTGTISPGATGRPIIRWRTTSRTSDLDTNDASSSIGGVKWSGISKMMVRFVDSLLISRSWAYSASGDKTTVWAGGRSARCTETDSPSVTAAFCLVNASICAVHSGSTKSRR